MPATAPENLRILDLGRLAYAPALDLQRRIHEQIVAGQVPPTVLLVEHDPVITVSRRRTARQHLLAPPHLLDRLGIDVQETDRGGDITYHGPGQLIAYPLVPLAPLGLSIGRYMRTLEAVVIESLAALGVTAQRDGCATGVWVPVSPSDHEVCRGDDGPHAGDRACSSNASLSKICALGVRLSRGVTLHGLALNVTTDLSHFNTIVPCGLLGRSVTSLKQLLGEAAPAMAAVKREMDRALRRHLTPAQHPCFDVGSDPGAPRGLKSGERGFAELEHQANDEAASSANGGVTPLPPPPG